jgi:hypothetical protein
VFLCFWLLVSPAPPSLWRRWGWRQRQLPAGRGAAGAGPASVEGCLLYVFDIDGLITHLVVWRNGTPEEMSEAYIGGRSNAPVPTWGGGGENTASSGSSGGPERKSTTGRRAPDSLLSRVPGWRVPPWLRSSQAAFSEA